MHFLYSTVYVASCIVYIKGCRQLLLSLKRGAQKPTGNVGLHFFTVLFGLSFSQFCIPPIVIFICQFFIRRPLKLHCAHQRCILTWARTVFLAV